MWNEISVWKLFLGVKVAAYLYGTITTPYNADNDVVCKEKNIGFHPNQWWERALPYDERSCSQVLLMTKRPRPGSESTTVVLGDLMRRSTFGGEISNGRKAFKHHALRCPELCSGSGHLVDALDTLMIDGCLKLQLLHSSGDLPSLGLARTSPLWALQ